MILWIYSIFLVAVVAGLPTSPVKRAVPRLGGVNLAGCDFGMQSDGSSGEPQCPGTDQIAHFVSKGANLFRLPVGWQYLVGNNERSDSLDATFFSTYDKLVKATLDAGAYAMIDLHNYARWNGAIIDQGGPSNEQFNNLWALLATLYKNQPKVIFGIMNEPHDMSDMSTWAATVQSAVNAIRAAGATTQLIAIPGALWSHAEPWVDGTNSPLLSVTDPAAGDGSLLVLDVHKYLDSDGSGKSTECTTNGLDTLRGLTTMLAKNGRKAIISEIGGGNTDSCISNLGTALKYIAENEAEYLGFAVWSAGSFDSTYELTITPENGQDNNLFVQAVQPYLPRSSGGSTNTSASLAQLQSTSRVHVHSSTTSPTTYTVDATTSPKASATFSKPPASATSSSASSTATVGANFQQYTGTLGGIPAPAVYAAPNGQFTTNGQLYNALINALSASCYVQMDACQLAANRGGNSGELTVANCNGQQIQACLHSAAATASGQ